jgi:hypothetical protein
LIKNQIQKSKIPHPTIKRIEYPALRIRLKGRADNFQAHM